MPNNLIKSKKLISKVLQNAKDKFKSNLISLILFGSAARGRIMEDSDIDLIVVCKTLPRGWRKRDEIIIGLEKIGFSFGRSVHIEALTEKEFKFSVKEGAPLMFEIFTYNKVIYDDGLFKEQMEIFKENIKTWNARKIDKFTWEVPELAVKV